MMPDEQSKLYSELCSYFEHRLSPKIKRREDPHGLANDVLNEAIKSGLDGESLKSFVETVRRRKFVDCLRRNVGVEGRSINHEQDSEGNAGSEQSAAANFEQVCERPSQHVAKLEELERLESAINKLPTKDKVVIEGELQGRKLSEIGESIGKSTEAARSDQRRAKEKLNKELRRKGMNSETMQTLEGTTKKKVR